MILAIYIGFLQNIYFTNECSSHFFLSHEIIRFYHHTNMLSQWFLAWQRGNHFWFLVTYIDNTIFFWMRKWWLLQWRCFHRISCELQEVTDPWPHRRLRSNDWIWILLWNYGKNWRLIHITFNLEVKDTWTPGFGRNNTAIRSKNTLDLCYTLTSQLLSFHYPKASIHTQLAVVSFDSLCHTALQRFVVSRLEVMNIGKWIRKRESIINTLQQAYIKEWYCIVEKGSEWMEITIDFPFLKVTRNVIRT